MTAASVLCEFPGRTGIDLSWERETPSASQNAGDVVHTQLKIARKTPRALKGISENA